MICRDGISVATHLKESIVCDATGMNWDGNLLVTARIAVELNKDCCQMECGEGNDTQVGRN